LDTLLDAIQFLFVISAKRRKLLA